MNTAEEKVLAFRTMITRLSERELVARIRAAGLMAAVDAEFARRIKPELIEEARQKLIEMGGVTSTEELLDILRAELDERNIAKVSQGAS